MPRYVVYFTRSLAPFLQLASPYLFISFLKWIFRDLSCSQILKPDKYPFLNRSLYRQKDIDLYMDISPYLNMEEPTRKGCNQRKVLTLSTTLFSDDVPWAKGAPIIFLSSTVPIRTSGLVRFLFQSIKFFVFVRDHVGRKVVCRGAAVKRRFPPFH